MCVYHDALQIEGVTKEEALVIVALAGHEVRPGFLEWFDAHMGKIPGPIGTALEAAARQRTALTARLKTPSPGVSSAESALAAVRAVLSGAELSLPTSSPTKSTCCGKA